MERVYLDAAVMIYYIERRAPWYSRVLTRLTATPVRVVVSDLTRLECRVKPVRTGDAVLLAEFDAAFAAAEPVPITTAVFDRATEIRAAHGFKTPDALHLAAAVEGGCDVFLTNDHRLDAFTGITVEAV